MADDRFREEMLQRGTSWLLEMELLDTPQLKNFLILNTYSVSKHVKDVEILLDLNYKAMLVYIQIGKLGRLLRKGKEIEETLLDQYGNILPSFRIRIVFEKSIFDLAVKKAGQRIGGRSENVNPSPTDGDTSSSKRPADDQSNRVETPTSPTEKRTSGE